MYSVIMSIFIATSSTSHLDISYKDEPITEAVKEDYIVPFVGLIESRKVEELISSINNKVTIEPINAELDEKGNIIPGKSGQMLDQSLFKEQFYRFLYTKQLSSMEVPIRTIYPRVDGELLDSIRDNQISEYVTYYNSGNKERSKNVSLSAKAINNVVVFPNETFSFNRIVGKRTKEKGYLPAPVIVKGELVEDIGGGICQVSSTLYNAIDRAGLKVTERYSHSKSVPYVPPKRDATVSWYGPDFSFQNNYQQPILIRAKAKNGVVTISIFSSNNVKPLKREVPEAIEDLPREIEVGE
ncbi:VanW family protein [Aquibacillus kalidii]|uniref:VanW family protein n=1 Tax=Aquibacillus kalidii TaxID=2762597 RepID=UPI0016496C6B|nr:VanW family protein [Aquibacillus kalidii]